ncbi:hypothetical protein BYT27DRAFT_7251028 [Phlegmacium glaucopus]|nr:hypothetical protein BYT27DRAFT_7251028 [Phlegmacium glaucopus]
MPLNLSKSVGAVFLGNIVAGMQVVWSNDVADIHLFQRKISRSSVIQTLDWFSVVRHFDASAFVISSETDTDINF